MIASLIIGAAAGWAAGQIRKGYGLGLIGNLAVGMVGAFIGSWLLGIVGFSAHGWLAKFATATGGAVLLLYVIDEIKGRKSDS
jgi:uncharacterized membrane protein YeaQ/YmgE (transglycosylase-associated protein family)